MESKDYDKEKRSWVMSRIKGADTKPEVKLRKRLWSEGLRYRKNVTTLPGKPDIVFAASKVAIFVDGRFWHNKKLSPERLSKMTVYWQEKIKKNALRDAKNNETLHDMGFRVLRFTDIDVEKRLDQLVDTIKSVLKRN